MEDLEQIQKIIDDINQRPVKNYHKMKIDEISRELRAVMEFERESFEKIDELERNGTNPEFAKYAKMICRNTTEREISEIQEIYLSKIDKEYLNN
ncbi:MAG: hypothetical protein K5785_01690 [Nitrosarchaeum sp.]|nr:hypothetical protein [Nitrosarchaeum sp.]